MSLAFLVYMSWSPIGRIGNIMKDARPKLPKGDRSTA